MRFLSLAGAEVVVSGYTRMGVISTRAFLSMEVPTVAGTVPFVNDGRLEGMDISVVAY